MPLSTELSVAQLRQEAKKSIGQVITPKITASSALLLAERTFREALGSDEQQRFREAFYKYQQGASLLSYVINLPEVKQAPKSSEIHKKVALLQTRLSSDYLPRSTFVEALLNRLEVAPNHHRHDATQGGNQVSEVSGAGLAPGASIADRMRLDELGPITSADKFSTTFPTIDELDTRDDWKLPPIPPGDPQLFGKLAVPSEQLADSGSSDALHRFPVRHIQSISTPAVSFRSPKLPPTANQSPMPLNSFPLSRSARDPKGDAFDIPNPHEPSLKSDRRLEGSRQVQPAMPVIPSALASSPPPIHYPRPASTMAPSSTLGAFPEGLRHSTDNTVVLTPPPASFSSSSGGRRRSDFVECWQPPLAAQISRPDSIDYPVLSPQLLPQPPAAVSSGSDRHERRPSSLQPFPKSTPKPTPLLIPSNYLVTTWGDVEIGISGLKNLGNTCYMNSTLQCLSATVPFVRFFQDGRWKTAVNMMNPLGSKGHNAQNFATLVSEMWRHEYTYLSPLTFRKGFCLRAPQFEGPNQHDAQEFLSSLLDGLHEDLNRVLQKPAPLAITPEREAELERLPPHVASSQEWTAYRMRNNSLVVDYFQGQFRNRLQCMTCEHTSTTYNPFMYLSLPLQPSRNPKGTLYQCLDAFVDEEVIDQGDAWKCPRCQALRRATKQLSLSRLPPVLLIQLKRFSLNGPFTDKLETSIDYPVRGLDLTRYAPPLLPNAATKDNLPRDDPRRQEPPFLYDLYAVTNHFGTLSTGHYTAYVASKGHWLLCDDSRVTSVDEREIVGRPAYILYYKRRGGMSR